MKKITGFTLIEILVASTIIIVLTSISLASFATANKSARDAKRKSDLESVRQALVLYKTQEGSYPVNTTFADTVGDLITGVSGRTYLTPPAPLDPINNGTYYYVGQVTSTTSFCFCVRMESGKGNSSASNCNSFVSSGGSHYCIRQP